MLIDENNKIKDSYLAKRQQIVELERKVLSLEEFSNSQKEALMEKHEQI